MMNTKEEKNIKNRILELANLCYFRELPTNTLFLNLYEQTIFYSLINTLPRLKYKIYGGYEAAERKIVCFLPYYAQDFDFSMLSALKISPSNIKFADKLNHRDFLGAILNLGLERNTIGDIILCDKEAYVIVLNKVKDIIRDNLQFIKNTKIKIEETSLESLINIDNTKEENINVASLRLDVLIAASFNKSRTSVSEYIMANLVFVNGRQTTNHSYIVKENDIVSVRGLGRFKFIETIKTTKKDRLVIKILSYV